MTVYVRQWQEGPVNVTCKVDNGVALKTLLSQAKINCGTKTKQYVVHISALLGPCKAYTKCEAYKYYSLR